MEYENKRQLLSARFDGYVDLELRDDNDKLFPMFSNCPHFVNIQNQKYEQILDEWIMEKEFTDTIPGGLKKGDIIYFSAQIELENIELSDYETFSKGDKLAWVNGYTSEDKK